MCSEIKTMERINSCRCCLRRPPDRDMKIPYITFGKAEIYSDMLKECFEIHLTKLLIDNECGICEVCVGRLRDASDFKLQVLRSQAELQGLLDKRKLVKEEEPLVKSEMPENDEELVNLGEEVKLEMSDPLPGGAETEFKEFELILDTHVSDGFKQEPMFDYALGQPSCPTKNELIASGVRVKKEHACKTCGQTFPKKILLNRHKNIHKHTSDNTCEICNKQFKYKCKLKVHRLVHTKPYVCDICNKKFARKFSLNRHKLGHSGEKPFGCDECHKKFRDVSYLNAHKRLHAGETYTCDLCKANFIRKHNLISHIGRHQGKKHYRCNVCFNRFWDYPSLYQHKKIHTGEIYKCGECEKVFTYKQGLASHLKTHAERTPYSCDFCTKQLATFASLQRHKLVHTGERAYSCEICNNSFRHKHNLLAHQLIHTGEKPHCCEVCGKQFARKDNLNTHLATHAEGIHYSCELCTKSYSTKEGLRQHRRSHRKNKIAKCIIKKLTKKRASDFQKSTDYILVNT